METRRDVFKAMTPNALAEEFHTSRQAVSKHIQILTECELVNQEQKGREIYYHMNADQLKETDQFMDQFRKILENQFNQLNKVFSSLKKSR